MTPSFAVGNNKVSDKNEAFISRRIDEANSVYLKHLAIGGFDGNTTSFRTYGRMRCGYVNVLVPTPPC